MKEVKPEFRSFNLAARAMRGYEADYILRQGLDICGDSIRWVLLEPQSWPPLVDKNAVGTQRDTDWHDLEHTLKAVRSTRDTSYPEEFRKEWSYHLKRFFYRLGNYGAGDRLWTALGFDEYDAYLTEKQIERGQGYVSIEESLGKWWPKHNGKFLERIDAYEQKIAKLAEATDGFLPPCAVERHREQFEYLTERGISVVYVMPPFVSGLFFRKLDAMGLTPTLLNFLDPKVYPQLYEVDQRLDEQHLKESGAAEFSRLVGERLAGLLGPRGEGSQ